MLHPFRHPAGELRHRQLLSVRTSLVSPRATEGAGPVDPPLRLLVYVMAVREVKRGSRPFPASLGRYIMSRSEGHIFVQNAGPTVADRWTSTWTSQARSKLRRA
jgi:hypothetical protein